MQRESIEWCQFYWFDTAAVHLPRILLIGDSIVAGHRQALAERLKGRATVAAFSTSTPPSRANSRSRWPTPRST